MESRLLSLNRRKIGMGPLWLCWHGRRVMTKGTRVVRLMYINYMFQLISSLAFKPQQYCTHNYKVFPYIFQKAQDRDHKPSNFGHGDLQTVKNIHEM